jgi:hypothetical protein
MIKAEELRIGNRVYWKPHFSNSKLLIQVEITSVLTDKVGYIQSHLEHRVEPFEDDMITKEVTYASFEELLPIPLTEEILKKTGVKIKYPGWLKSLHELQNWYYWENGKKDMEMND